MAESYKSAREEPSSTGVVGLSPDAAVLDLLIDALPNILIIMDKNGVYRRANRAAVEFFGFDPAGLTRHEMACRVNARFPDDVTMAPEAMPSTRALAGETVRDIEYLVTDGSGRTRWLLLNTAPLLEEGEVVGALVTNTDITARKVAEESNRKNMERVRLLAQTSAALLASADPKLVVRDLCATVMEHLDCQAFFSFRVDERAGRLRLLASAGVTDGVAAGLEWLDFGSAVCGCVARDRERIIAEEIVPGGDPRTELVASLGLRAYCCHPLLGQDGRLLGTLSFGTGMKARFAPDEVEFMKAVADVVAMALQRDWERADLARSEAQLKIFIEHAPAAIAMLDSRLRYIATSRKWREDCGLGETDLRGLSHFEVFPGLEERWKDACLRGLAGEVVSADDDRFIRADGALRRTRWEVRPWYGSTGLVKGIAVFIQDVTEEVNAREALKNSERLYRAIGESIDYGVWVCEPDGRNIYASESFLNLVGLTQEQCSSFGWGEVLHPDDAERTIAAWKECVRTGGKWDIEHRFKGVDGQYHEILARGMQVRDGDGKALFWAGINLDISNLKRTERELEAALLHLNSHMENTPLAVVERDSEFRVVRWAGAAEKMFGWPASEVVGRSIDNLNMIHEEDSATVAELTEAMLSGRCPSYVNANRNYRRDRSLIHCVWHNSAIYDDQGRLESVLSLVMDVTGRINLEQELLVAKEAAESANKAKTEFLARMSHELRTPLNGITGMIELTVRRELDATSRQYLELARQSTKSLLDIINDLLDLARIEARKVELETAPFILRQTLRHLTSFFGPAAEAKGLLLTLEVEPDLPPVFIGDEGRLRQVLINLVANAVKFTERGRVTVKVLATRRQAAPASFALRFEVEDTGIGIPPENLHSVFESFSPATRLTHAKYGGTGLGLSICKQLVALMGGEISVKSEPGTGTRFTFTVLLALPVALEAAGEWAGNRSAAEPPTRLKVLVADDNSLNRLFAQTIIEDQGHEVVTVSDGKEALEALAKGGFDLVFMDVQMPVMDGLVATRLLRSGSIEGCDRTIPVIAMTAHAFAEEGNSFLAAGMNDHIAKPIDLDRLDRVLAHWSEAKRKALPEGVAAKSGTEQLAFAGRRLDQLLERLPRDRVRELLVKSIDQLGPSLDHLETLVERGDAGNVATEVHKLRGTWTVVLGTERMIEISTAMEKDALGGSLRDATERVAELRKEAAALGLFLRREMALREL